MNSRKMSLAGSWYPADSREFEAYLGAPDKGGSQKKYRAAIVPHAGWMYSGRIAVRTLVSLCMEKDLIIVIGGHLPPGSGVLAATEDFFKTPAGLVKNKKAIIDELSEKVRWEDDQYHDNTVEVVLVMAAWLSKKSDFLWLRAPADDTALLLGDELGRICRERNIDAAVIGSTDLTHYGGSYGYSPAGVGAHARRWVETVNDAEIIELMTAMKAEKTLQHALKQRSACSPGAAAAAIRFASAYGVEEGELIGYTTSYEIQPSDSFVGYTGILY